MPYFSDGFFELKADDNTATLFHGNSNIEFKANVRLPDLCLDASIS